MSERLLSKEEFLQQYILNRALGHSGGLDGRCAAAEGRKAFDFIEALCQEDRWALMQEAMKEGE